MDPARLSFARDGVGLSCLDFGGSGRPVLLMHGLAGHAAEWSETASWLSQTHRVLALDERGHGHSERVPDDVSPEAHLDDVAALVRELGLDRVIVVGQSLGANLAFLLAARRPELVRGLVVAEGCPEADPQGEGAAAIRRWLEAWPAPFADSSAALKFFGGPSLYAEAWAGGLERREGGWWPRFEVEVMVRTLREATAAEHWEEWERIRCPTLVIRAGQGFFTRALLESMAERLAGCRYAEIDDARHDLHLDRPVRWRELLTGFLGELERG